jgi:hypothetical protein
MKEKERNTEIKTEETASKANGPKDDEWYTRALEEMDDFIESQGIYIRQ